MEVKGSSRAGHDGALEQSPSNHDPAAARATEVPFSPVCVPWLRCTRQLTKTMDPSVGFAPKFNSCPPSMDQLQLQEVSGLGSVSEAGPRSQACSQGTLVPALQNSPSSPVVGTVRGCDRGVCSVWNQPLEGRARAQADGWPGRGAHIAAASVEIAHQHDVLPEDTTSWPRDTMGTCGAQCRGWGLTSRPHLCWTSR